MRTPGRWRFREDPGIRVLIFHGYLLRGTGSNVYTASLAQALARLGHEVHLFCQDRRAGELSWVRDGSVTVHVPDIGGLLPVYVADRYEGFRVKTFPELTDAELDAYLGANLSAVRDVAESLGGIDAALANHLVMGPVVLARAGLDFAIKVHGSDLSYTVLPHLERFRSYAEEATAAASGILVGSAHIAARLRQAVDDPRVDAKVRHGPPGVDAELFSPIPGAEAAARLEQLARELEGAAGPSDSWERDTRRAAPALRRFAAAPGPRAIFVGKLIVSKGADLLLAAWPLVHAEHPGARLLIVGFGEYEPGLRRLWAALEGSRLEEAREVAAAGRALEGGEAAPLRMLASFLADAPQGYVEAARGAAGSVAFAGRLEHDEVGALLPAADALVFPSTFPEAFGMVAAEAAAAGVLPVSAGHSGAAEVSRALAASLPPEVAALVSFPLDEDAVIAIATRLDAWLGIDPETRDVARRSLSRTARRLWSWEGVARGILAASAGSLDELERVPAG